MNVQTAVFVNSLQNTYLGDSVRSKHRENRVDLKVINLQAAVTHHSSMA